MRVKIQRIDKSLPLPVYETRGSVGFDLIAREDVTVPPEEIALIPANVIVEVPKGYALVIASRSSTPKKLGLTKPHGIGIIDNDYCGPEDEIKIQVRSLGANEVKVKRGDKLAQGLFVKVDQLEFEEVDAMNNETRGGFGSTDRKDR